MYRLKVVAKESPQGEVWTQEREIVVPAPPGGGGGAPDLAQPAPVFPVQEGYYVLLKEPNRREDELTKQLSGSYYPLLEELNRRQDELAKLAQERASTGTSGSYYSVGGRVVNPGTFEWTAPTTVEEALKKAGGIDPSADAAKIFAYSVNPLATCPNGGLVCGEFRQVSADRSVPVAPGSFVFVDSK